MPSNIIFLSWEHIFYVRDLCIHYRYKWDFGKGGDARRRPFIFPYITNVLRMPEYQTVRKLVSEEIDSGNLPWNHTSEVPPFPVFEVALLLHFLAKQLHSHCIAGVATEQAERPRKYNIGGTGVRTVI